MKLKKRNVFYIFLSNVGHDIPNDGHDIPNVPVWHCVLNAFPLGLGFWKTQRVGWLNADDIRQ